MIRRATAADVEALLRLERSVAEAAHWNPAEYAAILQAQADDAALRRWVFVAEEKDQLLGFIVVKLLRVGEAVEAEIENIAVAGNARRQGTGTALWAAALAACEAAGAATVELEVRAGNKAAIGLYTRLGFKETGRRAGYYANPVEDAVLMGYKQKRA
jgi:ribosomal-protein-alanine N-acetyltransferase